MTKESDKRIDVNAGSGLIKGVGPKFAKKIVQKYGADTFFRSIRCPPPMLPYLKDYGSRSVAE